MLKSEKERHAGKLLTAQRSSYDVMSDLLQERLRERYERYVRC